MATTISCDRCGRTTTTHFKVTLNGRAPEADDRAVLGDYCSRRCLDAATTVETPDFDAARRAAGVTIDTAEDLVAIDELEHLVDSGAYGEPEPAESM